MRVASLCRILPEDVVRHILSFDPMIAIRRGNIHFIHKLDRSLYEDAFHLLVKKSLVREGRTIRYNNEISTWCSVRLKFYNQFYISYASNNNGVIFKICIWGKKGAFRQTIFAMP
jgi:hypothetical protein